MARDRVVSYKIISKIVPIVGYTFSSFCQLNIALTFS